MTTIARDKTVPGQTPHDTLDADQLKRMLQRMMLIRRFEERTMQSYMQQKIGGFCHIYIGQEAVAVGSVTSLRDDDPIITAYRDHGHALARGLDPRYAMAELFGKITGCAKGKGGSMHFFDKPHHMYGGHAIVGGQCPLGVGLAFAVQYEKKDNVVLCYLGDGALNQGTFHESMNLAAIWNLPIIFVLENNLYSMGTHIARGTSMADDLGVKAQAYGVRYAECDGLDILDVYDTFTHEIEQTRNATNPQWQRGAKPEYIREGRIPGPCFINAFTYRYQGHSMSDPQKYRSREEVAEQQENDCINRLVRHLIDQSMASQEQIDQMDNDAKSAAREALTFAEQSPETPMDELFTDVYSQPFGPYRKGAPPKLD